MAATIQIKRRLGTTGAPASLQPGEFGYNDPGSGAGDLLYIGTTPTAVKTLVGATRQVELTGAQTITGAKTIAQTNLKLTGGTSGQVLSTDGSGNLSWITAATGGITTVSHDTTLSGDGAGTPLSVLKWGTARTVGLTATGGTTITQTAASLDGSANVNISGFEVTVLDGGTY